MDSESLTARLAQNALPTMSWIAIGRCIRRFHDRGVCHADLNAHNILLGATEEAVYLIDFDRGRLRKPGLWCDSNLVRLRRSIEKVTYGLPEDRFTEADWHGLLDGYRVGADGSAAPAS
jgi:3-deoxy-D-manno-octulosonic acid kinase